MSDDISRFANRIGLKMKYKLLLTMILVSLIPLGGMWYISIYKAQQDATTEVYQKMMGSVGALADRVDEWHTMNLLVLQQNSGINDIQSMEANRQNPILKTISSNYKWIYLAFSVLPNGQNVGRSDGKSSQQYGDREYFQEIMNGELVGQQVAIGKTSGKPTLVLAIPVFGSDNQKKGILAFAMTLEELSGQVTNVSLGKTGYATLLDEKNRVIAKGKELSSELQDMSAHPAVNLAMKSDNAPFVFEEQGKRILACSKTTKQGWRLIVQQDFNEAFAIMQATRQNTLLLLLLTLVFVTLVAFMFSAGLTGPIRNLTEVADNMSRGELGVAIKETQRSDEIGALARAIERMGISLEMAFKRMRK